MGETEPLQPHRRKDYIGSALKQLFSSSEV